MLQITPYQEQLHAERSARLSRFSAAAVEDRPIHILSASERTAEAPIRMRQVLAPPPPRPSVSNDEAHALVWPWIPPESAAPAVTVKTPKIEAIQSIVGDFYEISRTHINATRRLAAYVRPRQIAMYLCRAMTLHSLPIIGHHFGRRDHTTVLHACRKIEAMIAKDPVFAAEIKKLKVMIERATGCTAPDSVPSNDSLVT